MVDEQDHKEIISSDVKELHKSLDLSQQIEYELKNRLASTEACLHDLEPKMMEKSSYFENTQTSLKNMFETEMRYLQSVLEEEKSQKENVHAELNTFQISYEELSSLSKSLQS